MFLAGHVGIRVCMFGGPQTIPYFHWSAEPQGKEEEQDWTSFAIPFRAYMGCSGDMLIDVECAQARVDNEAHPTAVV